jgi:four helix bundle protein
MTVYQNLEAWKKSVLLVKNVYEMINGYPREETYALAQQTKRSAISIPSNIAEGLGRNHKKDTIQFLHISRGSLYELETQIYIGNMLGFIIHHNFITINEQIKECLRLLNGLIKYIERTESR